MPQLEYPSFHNIIQCPNLSINFDQDESLQCFRKIKVNEINANLSHHTKYKIIKLKEFSHPLASSSFSDKVTLSTSYCILYIVYCILHHIDCVHVDNPPNNNLILCAQRNWRVIVCKKYPYTAEMCHG